MTAVLDLIRTKRDQLVLRRDQMAAGVNVLAGAISVCDELLEQIAALAPAEAAPESADAKKPPA
ncbi:hypothetical protein LOC51_00470 [Rubrivivax sp. JA1024]|nr:hypothetical protein [Rubrivivax sp. JA1024]